MDVTISGLVCPFVVAALRSATTSALRVLYTGAAHASFEVRSTWYDVHGAQCAVPGASYLELATIGRAASDQVGSRFTQRTALASLRLVAHCKPDSRKLRQSAN